MARRRTHASQALADRTWVVRSVRERLRLASAWAPELERELRGLRDASASGATRSARSAILGAGAYAGLRTVIAQVWREAGAAGVQLAADQVGAPIAIDIAVSQAPVIGARIRGITEETRRRVEGYVQEGMREGYSPSHLARLIREDPSGAFSQARAMVIARTETGTAYNLGSVQGYRASGRVERVRIFDGDDCGWTSHDDPDLADGSIRDLDEAEEQPLSHPNCVRAWAPVVESAEVP